MYIVDNSINTTSFQGLQVAKLLDLNAKEIIQVSLEANSIFPNHTSPREAHLLILEGEVSFFINDSEYRLLKHQVFKFPKDVEHWVEAHQNSIFLIIR